MRRLFMILLLFHTRLVFAQDPHFSQFFSSPLTLNPANTGNFNGVMRVQGIHRNQWPSFGNAYRTIAVAVDGPFSLKWMKNRDKLSLGMTLLSDQSGNGILKENHLGFSAAYTKMLDEDGNHSLTVGFTGELSNFMFDQNKANFEDELSASGFTIPSTEILLTRDLNRQFTDLHAGLLYKAALGENNLFYVGSSVYHLQRPGLGFADDSYNMQLRYNVHAGGYHLINEVSTFHLSMQYQHHFNYRELVVGGAFSRIISPENGFYTELYLGGWIRNNDALIPYLGMQWGNLLAGFSYDISYSKKRSLAALYQSAEFSLSWILQRRGYWEKIKCPRF